MWYCLCLIICPWVLHCYSMPILCIWCTVPMAFFSSVEELMCLVCCLIKMSVFLCRLCILLSYMQAMPWCMDRSWREDGRFYACNRYEAAKQEGAVRLTLLLTVSYHVWRFEHLVIGFHYTFSGLVVWWNWEEERDGQELSREIHSLLWTVGYQSIGRYKVVKHVSVIVTIDAWIIVFIQCSLGIGKFEISYGTLLGCICK